MVGLLAEKEIIKYLSYGPKRFKEIHSYMKRAFGEIPKSTLWYGLQKMRKEGVLFESYPRFPGGPAMWSLRKKT
jgi:hypothetical protein